MSDTERRMPDRILEDWSNLKTVVSQFRNLGYNDTYILETVMNCADIFCGRDVWNTTNEEVVK